MSRLVQSRSIAWRKNYFLWTLFGLAAVASIGCRESGPAIAPVEGVVTLDGQPIENAVVTFYPDRGRAALGTTDQAGSFALTTFNESDGALIGRHTITVQATEVFIPNQPKSFDDEIARGKGGGSKPAPRGVVRWKAPQAFSDAATSGLTAEVQPGTNTIDLQLTSSASAKKDR